MSFRHWLVLPALLVSACSGPAPQPQAGAALAPTAITNPASGADCAGKDLRITRDDFNLVIHGECRQVVVTGSRGALNLDRATAIRVEGSHVTLLNEQAGEILVTGHDNILNLTTAGPLTIEGDRNMVLARDIASVSVAGRENTINPDNAPALEDSGTGNRLL